MNFKRLLILLLPLLTIIFPLQVVQAATAANTFQITTDGSQQTSPFVYNNMVVYTSLSDIWGYDFDSNTNFAVLEKDGFQFTTDLHNNLIVYEDIPPSEVTSDVRMYNLRTGEDKLIAGGSGSQGGGATNGRVVAYIDGGACGSLKLYNIHKKTTKQIVSSTCQPVRVSADDIIFAKANPNGTDIQGYNINHDQLFDISTDPGFQDSANISGDKVVWLDYITGARGDYNAIKMKDLDTGEVKTIYESSVNSLQWPAISDKYVVWSESSAQHVNGIKAADLKTGEEFEVQAQGPHQNSHTMPSIWRNVAVWQAFRTGNGDIYASEFNKAP